MDDTQREALLSDPAAAERDETIARRYEELQAKAPGMAAQFAAANSGAISAARLRRELIGAEVPPPVIDEEHPDQLIYARWQALRQVAPSIAASYFVTNELAISRATQARGGNNR
jgi:hypothetical protein